LEYVPSGSGLSQEEAVAMQRIAWEAVQLWNAGGRDAAEGPGQL
jgi:hypothetical protein